MTRPRTTSWDCSRGGTIPPCHGRGGGGNSGEEAPEASWLQIQQCVHAVAAEGNQDGPVCDGRNGLTLAIDHQKFAVEQE